MTQTLLGKRIVNTRAAHQAAAFDALIKQRGAVPLSYPCITIQAPEDTSQLDAALHQLRQGVFDWLVLTSANTIHIIAQRLHELHLSLSSTFKVAAIGPSTARETQAQLGLNVDLMPDEYIAEALAEALHPSPGMRACLPESAIARPTLADKLRTAGAVVTVITAYETTRGNGGVDLPTLLAKGDVDAITFTSSSTVRFFVDRLHDEGGDIAMLGQVCLTCIGPKTTITASELGLDVAVSASPHTLDGILNGLENYFNGA